MPMPRGTGRFTKRGNKRSSVASDGVSQIVFCTGGGVSTRGF
jgi:hypothetical protein